MTKIKDVLSLLEEGELVTIKAVPNFVLIKGHKEFLECYLNDNMLNAKVIEIQPCVVLNTDTELQIYIDSDFYYTDGIDEVDIM